MSSSSSSPSYFDIQKPSPDGLFAPYSGKTSMSEAASKASLPSAKDKDEHKKKTNSKEGFSLADLYDKARSDPKYDMSYNLLNYPQGHPLYEPQTIAETYSSDTKSLLDMEEIVLGLALLGGVSVMVIGLLISGAPGNGGVAPST